MLQGPKHRISGGREEVEPFDLRLCGTASLTPSAVLHSLDSTFSLGLTVPGLGRRAHISETTFCGSHFQNSMDFNIQLLARVWSKSLSNRSVIGFTPTLRGTSPAKHSESNRPKQPGELRSRPVVVGFALTKRTARNPHTSLR